MSTQKNIYLYYIKAGGGHVNAKDALIAYCADHYPQWNIIPVDVGQLLKSFDPIYKITDPVSRMTDRLSTTSTVSKSLKVIVPDIDFKIQSHQTEDIYNYFLRRNMTRGFGKLLPLMQRYIRIPRNAKRMQALVADHIQANGRPDLCVSVVPNFNAILWGAIHNISPYKEIPYVTIMTDMVDVPPHFWMEDQDQSIICGTPRAYQQAVETGFYSRDKIVCVSGMILKKSFYDLPQPEAPSLSSLGLSTDVTTALIMFGGNGSSISHKIVKQLHKANADVQTIVLCGHNRELFESLQGLPACHAIGFVSNVVDYMRLADFFIGKPGPGSISEAIHMGCPVLLERNESTMPQESPNVDWVLEHGLGLTVTDFRKGKEVVAAVKHIRENLVTYQDNIRKLPANNAIHEVVTYLNHLMNAAPRQMQDTFEDDHFILIGARHTTG